MKHGEKGIEVGVRVMLEGRLVLYRAQGTRHREPGRHRAQGTRHRAGTQEHRTLGTEHRTQLVCQAVRLLHRSAITIVS
jgi:hypothetical protein